MGMWMVDEGERTLTMWRCVLQCDDLRIRDRAWNLYTEAANVRNQETEMKG